VDALDTYGSTVRALIQSGVPDSIAADRASLVFGLTSPDQRYLDVAKSLSIGYDVLEAAADQALVEHVAPYARDMVGKAWDESEVNRDEKGQFATEGGAQYRVVGGKKYAIQQQVAVARQAPEEEVKVQRGNTDNELLASASAQALRDKRKEAKKKRLKKIGAVRTARAHVEHRLAQERLAEQKAAATQVRSKTGSVNRISGKTIKYRGDKMNRSRPGDKEPEAPPQPPTPHTFFDKYETYTGVKIGNNLKLMPADAVVDDDRAPLTGFPVPMIMDTGDKRLEVVNATDMLNDYKKQLDRLSGRSIPQEVLEDYESSDPMYSLIAVMHRAAKAMTHGIKHTFNADRGDYTGGYVMLSPTDPDDGNIQVNVLVKLSDLLAEMQHFEPHPSLKAVLMTDYQGRDGMHIDALVQDRLHPDKWSEARPIRLHMGAQRDVIELQKSWNESSVVRNEHGEFAVESGRSAGGKLYAVAPQSQDAQRQARARRDAAKKRKLQKINRLRTVNVVHPQAVSAHPAAARANHGMTAADVARSQEIRYRGSRANNTAVATSEKDAVKEKNAARVSAPQAQPLPVENGFKIDDGKVFLPLHDVPAVKELRRETERVAVTPDRAGMDGRFMLPPGSLIGLGRGTKNMPRDDSGMYLDLASVKVLQKARKVNQTDPVVLDVLSGSGTYDDPFVLGDTIHDMTNSESGKYGTATIIKSAPAPVRVSVTTLTPGGIRWITRS
jgi:hypothetical protein